MSLDDKIINPMAPVEPPTQKSDAPLKPGKKRRKGEGVSSRKAKKREGGDDSADDSAVLTLGSGDGARRAPKKMLFEPANEAGAAPLTTPPRERADSTRAALSMTAAIVPETLPQATAPQAAPVAEPKPLPVATSDDAPAPQPLAAAPAARERSTGTVRGSIFQTPPREPVPAPDRPQPSTEASSLQSPVDTDGDQALGAAVVAYDNMPPADAVPATQTSDDASSMEIEAETVAFAPVSPPTPPAALTGGPVPADSLSPPPAAEEPKASPVIVEMAPPSPPAPVRLVPSAASAKAASAPTVEQTSGRGSAGLSRSEAIARAARLSALRGTGATASPSAAPARSSAPPAPQQQRPTELPKHPSDLYGYWTRVKNGRRFPSRADFDVEQVAENWPNSMLLTCGGNGGQMNFSSILRLGANRRSRPGEDLNFTSMITEWILAIGGEAVRAGTPVQDTEVFPSPEGTFAYKIVALPLSDQQTRVDHVLCHLSRS